MTIKRVIKALLGGRSRTEILEWLFDIFQRVGFFVMPI